MTNKRPPDSIRIYVPTEEAEALREAAVQSGISMKILAGLYIKWGITFRFHEPGADERINMAFRLLEGDEYMKRDDSCVQFQFSKTEYFCIKGSKGKQPKVKRLGKTLDNASAICRGCKMGIAKEQRDKDEDKRERERERARRDAHRKEHGYTYRGVKFWEHPDGTMQTEKYEPPPEYEPDPD